MVLLWGTKVTTSFLLSSQGLRKGCRVLLNYAERGRDRKQLSIFALSQPTLVDSSRPSSTMILSRLCINATGAPSTTQARGARKPPAESAAVSASSSASAPTRARTGLGDDAEGLSEHFVQLNSANRRPGS